MKKKDILVAAATFVLCIIVLIIIDYHIAETYFCAACDYNENDTLYRLFYRNDGNSAYHSYPTTVNYVCVFIISIAAGRFAVFK
jgi:Ni,Fe-hydrogenase I cytochrome b subunit